MTCGPLTISSPVLSGSRVFFPVFMSTILASVFGQGIPIEPIFIAFIVASSGLQCVTGELSVSP